MNILLEYREKDGWLHHLTEKNQYLKNSIDFQTICESISSEQALEFGEYLYNKFEKEFKDGNFPTFNQIKQEFEEFLKS